MEALSKIYQDTDEILGKPVFENGLLLGRKLNPTEDDRMSRLNEYSKQFINETDIGKIKTILIITKPYRDNPIISETRDAIKNNYEKQFGKLI